MTRFTLKSALAGVVLAGTLSAIALPNAVRASSPRDVPGPSSIGERPIVYHDPFNGAGQYRSDQALGFKTHWEGVLNLSDPTSPLVWTRVKDESAASSATITAMQPSLLSHSGPRMRPLTLPYTDCSSGSGSGGIRMWHGDNNVGDCIRFTGTGSQPLTSINYPYSPYPVSSSLSMGTVGSSGHGYLSCAGGNWNFSSCTLYQHLLASSGSADCDGSHNYVYTIYSL